MFGKLYAVTHLRADRWYKLTRTVLYGRLEDEKPFSSVRRLVEYEDHLLRLLRDAGLPTPEPLGFVEITPEREYVILMEFFEGAVEVTDADVDRRVIRSGLSVVRKLWDAGSPRGFPFSSTSLKPARSICSAAALNRSQLTSSI